MFSGDITINKIIEKTKRMLGENYKGDKELVPVHSSFSPIEGHTDSFLTVSNDKFSHEDIGVITEKTKNYAWWIANRGYLIDDTEREISALFIYGSEIGDRKPDVLNFNGTTHQNFYELINRTDKMGVIDNSESHLYIQFLKDGITVEHEVDVIGVGEGTITINEVVYRMYAGRLYPEDKVIIDNDVVYPIYLISNLDYYCIPTVGEKGEHLNGAHSASFAVQDNLAILEDTCDMVIHEAAQWTNRLINDKLLNECWPVIVKCACMAYLNRGAEHLNSQSELGQQNVYVDWVTVLHQQLTNRRYVL